MKPCAFEVNVSSGSELQPESSSNSTSVRDEFIAMFLDNWYNVSGIVRIPREYSLSSLLPTTQESWKQPKLFKLFEKLRFKNVFCSLILDYLILKLTAPDAILNDEI